MPEIAYLTGTTASLNFPVTPSAVFPAHDTCTSYCYDAFVAKISTTGEGLEYATYLGGSGTDYGNAIAVDASGNAYISGHHQFHRFSDDRQCPCREVVGAAVF